jgi:hypothetical protein
LLICKKRSLGRKSHASLICRHFLTFLLSFCKSIALSVIVGYDEKNEVDASERSAKH